MALELFPIFNLGFLLYLGVVCVCNKIPNGSRRVQLKLCQAKVSKLEKDLRDCQDVLTYSTPAPKQTVRPLARTTKATPQCFNECFSMLRAAKAILGKI